MNIKAWLVTGSRMWHDAVCLNEASADARIAARNSDGDRKVPLVDADELSRAYALIEEMCEALKRIDASGSGMVMASGAQYVVPMHSIENAREIVATADAFLAERVK